jgi:hypothetical protein
MIGKLFSPWMQPHLGDAQMDLLKAIRHPFDPNAISKPRRSVGAGFERSSLAEYGLTGGEHRRQKKAVTPAVSRRRGELTGILPIGGKYFEVV